MYVSFCIHVGVYITRVYRETIRRKQNQSLPELCSSRPIRDYEVSRKYWHIHTTETNKTKIWGVGVEGTQCDDIALYEQVLRLWKCFQTLYAADASLIVVRVPDYTDMEGMINEAHTHSICRAALLARNATFLGGRIKAIQQNEIIIN